MDKRELTYVEQRLKVVLGDTRKRMNVLNAQKTCDHIWVGQDDVHPHGTPRETFICDICGKEEVR